MSLIDFLSVAKIHLEVLRGCINNNFLLLQYIHFRFLCVFILCKVVADAIEVPFQYKIFSDKCVVVNAIEVVTNALHSTL